MCTYAIGRYENSYAAKYSFTKATTLQQFASCSSVSDVVLLFGFADYIYRLVIISVCCCCCWASNTHMAHMHLMIMFNANNNKPF